MVTSEATPYAKTGGLADMVAALSRQLAENGHEVKVLLPLYGSLSRLEDLTALPAPFRVNLPDALWCRLWQAKPADNLTLYFLQYDRFFGRPELYTGPYGAHGDNPERFCLLSRAAIDLPNYLHWIPDVFHLHDWMTALVPVYLETVARSGPLEHTASLLTLHNLAHQGFAPRSILNFAGLPEDLFRPDALESCGSVNFLKGGIYFANKLTTVSPTYAEEIRRPEFGHGLHPILSFRGGDLIGILNGIDRHIWDPQSDPAILKNYSADDLSGKQECRMDLLHRCDFLSRENEPLFGIISRLDRQKGLDILLEILPSLLGDLPGSYVFLGSGERALEERLQELANGYPGRVFCRIGYDEDLAHKIEAGADFFLMPSRFEPCGLNQLYSMAYGTLPIVRATGGLRDTVDNYDGLGGGTGFVFNDLSPAALRRTIGWAIDTFLNRPDAILALRRRAMGRDFSWPASARAYEHCYRWALEKKL